MNRTKTLALSLATLFVGGLVLAPSPASAQVRTRRDDGFYQDDYDRRAPRVWEVKTSVDRAERQSNSFRAWYEGTYRRDRLGRDPRARDFKHDIQRMDEAMERLRRHADDRKPFAGREDLQEALGFATEIDREITRDRDTRFTYREWTDLRDTLDHLARVYEVRGV